MSEERDGRTLNFPNRLSALAWGAIYDAYNVGLRRAFEEEEEFNTVVWKTMGDEKVCFICLMMDGVEFNIHETEGLLPCHVFGRCQFIPKIIYEGD